MPTIFVRSGRDIYDVHQNPYALSAFELSGELNAYSSADFFSLIRQECAHKEERFFLLPETIMHFFYEKDKADLEEIGTDEAGDPFTVETNTHYRSRKTGNTWTVRRCRGAGIHGMNGVFYIFHMEGCTFQSA